MANGRTAYVNARLLDPATGLDAPGGLLCADGLIIEVGPGVTASALPSDAKVIDCKGACLAPGLVDMRVQLREPGEEHKEDIETASLAAAAGGVTSMVGLPNTDPVVDDVAGVEFVARRARDVKLVKVYTYASLTKRLEGQEITEIGLLSDYGAVGFTDGVKPVGDANVMRRALAYSTAFDTVIIQHPEVPELSGGHMNSGALATRLGLGGINPLIETMMIERDLHLVEMTGGRYHVAHVTTARAVEVIAAAKARGLPVTCDTAPHYFTLNEQAVNDYRTFGKVPPPLRSDEDRAAIAEAVASGVIDAVASDHAPHDPDAKRLPFALADFGIVGLETLLPLTLALYHDGKASLIDLMASITSRPAQILGLKAGQLKASHPADLVIFDPDADVVIDPDSFKSKSKNSPFEDYPTKSKVMMTIVDGRQIFEAD